MATLEQENSERERLNDAIEKLSQVSPESLVRREKLGYELSFEAGIPFFTRTLKLFRDLRNCSLDGVSHSVLQQLANAATEALTEFENIQNFSIQQHPQDALQVRDQLINRIRDRYDHYYKIITSQIAYSIRKGTDFEALEQQAREIINGMHQAREEQLRLQERIKSESEEILDSMRHAAAEAGVSQHAIHFKEEATRHEKVAKRWLAATISVGILAIVFVIYNVYFYSKAELVLSLTQNIQLALAKLIGFSILYFALIWTGRNYRAHRHNYVVNKHRQNALSTFQAFVKAAGDDATKNAVLIRSTEAIFSPAVSGYLIREPEPQGTSQVLEIVRGALEKKPG